MNSMMKIAIAVSCFSLLSTSALAESLDIVVVGQRPITQVVRGINYGDNSWGGYTDWGYSDQNSLSAEGPRIGVDDCDPEYYPSICFPAEDGIKPLELSDAAQKKLAQLTRLIEETAGSLTEEQRKVLIDKLEKLAKYVEDFNYAKEHDTDLPMIEIDLYEALLNDILRQTFEFSIANGFIGQKGDVPLSGETVFNYYTSGF